MIAEVFGLSFFALLLMQITSVYEELGSAQMQQDAIKDGILHFLKRHLSGGTQAEKESNSDLIDRVIKFLHFKSIGIPTVEAEGLSAAAAAYGGSGGRSKSSNGDSNAPVGGPQFSELSIGLQCEIKRAILIPVLTKIKLFGHSAQDEEDSQMLHRSVTWLCPSVLAICSCTTDSAIL